MAGGSIDNVRHSEFWQLMTAHFGAARAESVARDHVFSAVGQRTIRTALAAGEDPKALWLLVCDTFDIPETLRYGLPD